MLLQIIGGGLKPPPPAPRFRRACAVVMSESCIKTCLKIHLWKHGSCNEGCTEKDTEFAFLLNHNRITTELNSKSTHVTTLDTQCTNQHI